MAYKQEKFISSKSGVWEVQDQEVGRFKVWERSSSSLTIIFFTVIPYGRRGRGLSRFSLFLFLSIAALATCGNSPARGQIGAVAASLHHINAGYLTHWVRPGIEPTSSWIPSRFCYCWATMGTPKFLGFWYIQILSQMLLATKNNVQSLSPNVIHRHKWIWQWWANTQNMFVPMQSYPHGTSGCSSEM